MGHFKLKLELQRVFSWLLSILTPNANQREEFLHVRREMLREGYDFRRL